MRLQSKVTIRIEVSGLMQNMSLLQQILTLKELASHIRLISTTNFTTDSELSLSNQMSFGEIHSSKAVAVLNIAMSSFCSANDLLCLAEGDLRRQSEGTIRIQVDSDGPRLNEAVLEQSLCLEDFVAQLSAKIVIVPKPARAAR